MRTVGAGVGGTVTGAVDVDGTTDVTTRARVVGVDRDFDDELHPAVAITTTKSATQHLRLRRTPS
jgi:copper homeostasis protein CutC